MLTLCLLATFARASGPTASPETRPLHTLTGDEKTKPAAPANDALALHSTGNEQQVGGSMTRTIVALGTVVGVILILGLVVKRLAKRSGGLMGALGPGGRAPSGLLEVLGRYPVARGTTLVLLKLDRRVMLLCQSGGGKLGGGAGMSTLCEITDPEEVASILLKTRDEEGDTLAQRFQSMLRGEENSAAEVLEPPVEPAAPCARSERSLAPIASSSTPGSCKEASGRDQGGWVATQAGERAGGRGRTSPVILARLIAIVLAVAALAAPASAQHWPPRQ